MRTCCLVLLILVNSRLSFSQVTEHLTDEQSLRQVLEYLGKRYDMRFSFADEVVDQVAVSVSPEANKSLSTLLADLERQSQLKFEQISRQYVIIRPYADGDTVEVCGLVTGDNHQPMTGVAIITPDPSVGAITDETGYFHLVGVSFSSMISFQHLGFTTRQVKASQLFGDSCRTVRLRETVEVLEELVVRDYLTVGITKKAKDLKISLQDLKILPGLVEPDILQSIQQSPGVISPYETATGLHVRGGSPDQNLVLWNGIKTYNQGHFFGMLSAFNPYIAEEVTFIRNGTSARYGDRVSSVIDIRTRETVSEEVSGGAGFNMIYADAYLNLPVIKDRLSLQLSGRRSFTDLVRTFTYNQYSNRVFQNTKITDRREENTALTDNKFFFNDFTTNLTWQLSPKNKVVINSLYNRNSLDFRSGDSTGIQAYNDLLNTANEGYNFRWISELNNSFSISADLCYAKYLLEYEFRTTLNDTTDVSSKKNLIRDFGGGIYTIYTFKEKHRLLSGYQHSDNTIRYAFEAFTPLYELVLDDDNRRIRTHAAYAEYQYEDPDNTLISAGIRTNYYQELQKNYLEPRVFMQQKVVDNLNVSLSGEYRTQVASQIKESVVSDLSLENQVWTLSGKEKFPVIESYQLTGGFSYTPGSWHLDLEGYRKYLSGVTTLTFGFLNPLDNEFRQGNSNILGADVFIKKQFRRYKTWAGYSYLFTENKFSGLNDDRPFPGNWNIEHTLKWSHIYTFKGFQASLGWIWHTGKSYTDVSEISGSSGPVIIQYQSLNGNTLPVYHRLDFSVIYDFYLAASKHFRYRVALSVLNVYNRKNILNREFRTTPSLTNELIDTKIYSLGITPNLVFRVFW